MNFPETVTQNLQAMQDRYSKIVTKIQNSNRMYESRSILITKKVILEKWNPEIYVYS